MIKFAGSHVFHIDVIESKVLKKGSISDLKWLCEDIENFSFVSFFEFLRVLNSSIDDLVGIENVLGKFLVCSSRSIENIRKNKTCNVLLFISCSETIQEDLCEILEIGEKCINRVFLRRLVVSVEF